MVSFTQAPTRRLNPSQECDGVKGQRNEGEIGQLDEIRSLFSLHTVVRCKERVVTIFLEGDGVGISAATANSYYLMATESLH